MFQYLLEISICWILIFFFFKLFLQKESYHKYNRFYLLGGLFLGLIIPFIHIAQTPPIGEPFIFYIQNLEIEFIKTQASPNSFSWKQWLGIFYIIGLLIHLLMLFRHILQMHRIRKSSQLLSKNEQYSLWGLPTPQPPFTYGSSIFVGAQHIDQIPPVILKHERAHIEHQHHIDLWLLELIKIAFWFHPLPYLFKEQLINIHEYQADKVVLKDTTTKEYGQALLAQAIGVSIPLTHPFAKKSQLKQRIKRMTSSPSQAIHQLKYIFILPIIGLLFVCFSFKAQDKSIYTTGIDRYPLFGACEEAEEEANKQCSSMALAQYVGQQLTFPQTAKAAGISGNVIAEFIIDEQGKVSQGHIVRSLHPDCDAVVLDILNTMPEWKPGLKNNRPVKVKMVLPVRFELK